jgi:acyl-coenzyme A thioesterase PaaI-like protein
VTAPAPETGYRYLTGTVLPLPEDGDGLPPFHLPFCFGCGPENQQGLGLTPRLDGAKVTAEIEFAPWFQGGPGLVHGGAIAAFFDDLMGFVLMAHLTPGVTAKLEVNYLRPVPLGITIRGFAWLAERSGRKLWVEAVGEDDAYRYVETRALFLPVAATHFATAVEHLTPEQQERNARYRSGDYYP